MRSLSIALLTCAETFIGFAQDPPILWGEAADVSNTAYNEFFQVESDDNNDIYALGFYYGAIDFDPGAGVDNIDCGSNGSRVLLKRYSNGDHAWALKLPINNAGSFPKFLINGNEIILSGRVNIPIGLFGEMNPLGTVSTTLPYNTVFLAKYSTLDGSLIWLKDEPADLYTNISDMSMDGSGNIIQVGSFFGLQDFDFSSNVEALTGSGSEDMYIAKYNNGGDLIWVKQCEMFSTNERQLAVNNSGEIFIAGHFFGTIDVNPDPVIQTMITSSSGAYILKLNSNGIYQWSRVIDTPGSFPGVADIIATNTNVYTFGRHLGTIDLSYGFGVGNSTAANEATYLARYTTNGTYVTHMTIPGTVGTSVHAKALKRSSNGDLHCVGGIRGTLDFDAGPGVSIETSTFWDWYSFKVNSSFDFQWSQIMNSSGDGWVGGIALCENGNIALGGRYNRDVDLDPSAGTYMVGDPARTNYNAILGTFGIAYPEISVLGNAAVIENNSTVIDDSLNTDFGNVCINNPDTSQFNIWNTGPSGLTLSGITLSGPDAGEFEVSSPFVSVNSGEQYAFEVIALTGSPGIKNATVTIQNDDPNESSYSFDIQVVVHDNPAVGIDIVPNQMTFCSQDAVTFNGTGANTYVWTNGISNNTQFPITTGGSYEVIGTSAFGCKDTTDVSIIVNPLPTVTVASNDPNDAICLNDAVQLIGAGANSYSYTGGVADQTDFFPTTTDTYTVTGTDGNGCQNTAAITIAVNPLPTVSVTSNDPNDAICLNDGVQLIGAGATTYSYTSGVIDQTDFFPSSTATYTVTGTDGNGCQNTADITITVNPLPTVSIASNDPNNEICLNDAVQLIGAGANSYSYTGGVADQTDFFPTTTDTYTVTGTDGNGCQNTAEITITVNPLPTVSVTSNDPNDAICLNDGVQLIGAGATTYSYTSGVTDQTDFFPSSTATYTVTGTDGNGCQNTADITITVNNLPMVSVTSTELDDTLCLNDSIQLIGAGAIAYAYTGGILDQTNFAPTTTDTYYVTGTDANGCQNDSSITIYIEALPTIDAGADLFACFGDSVLLFATGSGTITWTGNLANNTYFTPTLSSQEMIGTALTPQGCTNSDTIVVTMGNQINNSLTSSVDTVIATAGYANYAWFDCNTNASVGTGVENWVTVGYDGDFYAVISDSNGCTETTDCVTIDFTDLEQLEPFNVSVYPNPTTGNVNISSGLAIQSIDVYDNSGRLILTIDQPENSADLSNFARGNYLLKITIEQSEILLRRITKY